MAQSISNAIFDPVEVGAMMREARESLNHGISDVASELRIRESYLLAIEEGRLGDLPGPAYATGFLRSYGDYLKIDGSRIANDFKASGGIADQHTSLSMPAPVDEGSLPTGSVLMIAGVLAIMTYSVWYYMSSSTPGTETEQTAEIASTDTTAPADAAAGPANALTENAENAKAPKPEQAAPAKTESAKPEALKPAPEPKKAAVEPPRVAGPSPIQRGRRASTVADEAVATAETETAIRVPEQPTAVARLPATRSNPRPAAPAPAPPSNDDAARTAARQRNVATPAVNAGPVTIVVRATADSWVEVRKGREQPVLSRLMRTGETFEIPDDGGYLINTGNAGAIEILVNGKTVPPIGREGQITRDVALDARRLQGGQAAAR